MDRGIGMNPGCAMRRSPVRRDGFRNRDRFQHLILMQLNEARMRTVGKRNEKPLIFQHRLSSSWGWEG